MTDSSNGVISNILKHDDKTTSYKIALLRAINDVVFGYPDLTSESCDVAIPLRVLAEAWLAYYWAFADRALPIYQGARSLRKSGPVNDISFRPALTQLRDVWTEESGLIARPSDGFLLINEMRVSRRRAGYRPEFVELYQTALARMVKALEMPIKHAGTGHWTVFDRPCAWSDLSGSTMLAIPGTQPTDVCLVIRASLWRAFYELSLYVEALCIHEWCLFTDHVSQVNPDLVDRGKVYRLLTDRPNNRRPLTWERNQIDVLLMEGKEFICPWSGVRIRHHVKYDLDHIVPVALYPINDLWNLVPADPGFNSRTKRDRLPSSERLVGAAFPLAQTFSHYESLAATKVAMREEANLRFSSLQELGQNYSTALTVAVSNFVDQVANSRNWARF